MNTYSKALRHISMRDVKQKHQQKLTEQKFQEELKKKEERYIKSVMETKKYDWRKEIERVDNKVEEEVIINTVDDFVQAYDWKSEIIRDRSKYFETEPLEEGMTTSDMFFTTLNPPQDTYDNPIVTSPTTTISYANAIDSSTRLITLGTFDISTIDQFEVNATRLGSGGDSYGWALQANGTVIAAGGANDPIRVATASQLALFKSGRVTLTMRQSTIPAFGDNATNPAVTGWTIENVKFYRTVPTNVFVSLDSPEASAFIRTDPFLSKLSPEERKQKLKEMLESSDEYVAKIFGDKFPGSGAVPPGESGDVPGVEITDYQPQQTQVEKSTQQYQNSINDFEKTFNAFKTELSSISAKASALQSFNNIVQGKEPAFAVGSLEGMDSAKQSEVLKALGSTAASTFNQIQQYKELNQKLSQSKNPADWDRAVQISGSIQQLYDKFGKEMKGEIGKAVSLPPDLNQNKIAEIDKKIAELKAQAKQSAIDARNNELAAVATGAGLALIATLGIGALISSTSAVVPSAAARVSAALDALKKSADAAKTARAAAARSMGQNSKGTGMGDRWSGPQFDSYEPQGQLISERKKLKSPEEVLNKIPGYYDGKPAPLGFPETPPPEMVNGMHPDLVDGKKVSGRFNRLDPESAKATPLTGNTHVDKKILKARKQPK